MERDEIGQALLEILPRINAAEISHEAKIWQITGLIRAASALKVPIDVYQKLGDARDCLIDQGYSI